MEAVPSKEGCCTCEQEYARSSHKRGKESEGLAFSLTSNLIETYFDRHKG